nr:glycosyltransferase family 4 protein [Robbsia betulipollinis]
MLNTLSFKKQIIQAISQDNVDILYVQEYWYGRYDLLAKWFGKKGRPLIVGADHGGSKDDWLLWKKRKSFSKSDLLTSQTKLEVEEVRALGGRAVLLPNPVDVKFFSPAENSETGSKKNKTVITVGRFNNSQKRTTDLIEAFRYMDESWHLDIYGVGPDKVLLEETIRKFGLESKVTMKGFVSDRTQMRDSYRACTVFCLPSAHEGLPMVALEAMSCGCAVVVTDIRALENLVTNGVDGIKVRVGHPEELAQGIRKAHEEAPRLGAAARATIIEKHSADSFMENFVAALGL